MNKINSFVIKTLGCKVNQYESQVIREQLCGQGLREVGVGETPDLCIINTCSVTSRAQSKGKYYLNRFRSKFPNAECLVTGCTVDYQPGFFSAVTLVPNKEKYFLHDRYGSSAEGSVFQITQFAGHSRAFVKVQDGCNQYCSYCILPHIRGRSRNRKEEEIISEVNQLAANGYKEIVLTGIHLGDYSGLAGLLSRLADIQGLKRIRLSSLEPEDITPSLLRDIKKNTKLCHHFHIPLQSGDDEVLRRMNRKYSYNQYKRLINDIKITIPDTIFTTDMIIGFPGETEEQFANSCRAVEEIGFAKVHVFPYSNRPGTAAAALPGRVTSKEIKQRVRIIQDIAKQVAAQVKQGFMGTEQKVFIEKNGYGYTAGYLPVVVKQTSITNDLIEVKITGIKDRYLLAEPLE